MPGSRRDQGETNERLGRIEATLTTSSKLFELMHERLENLEDGQQRTVARLESVDKHLESVDKHLESVDKHLESVDKRLEGLGASQALVVDRLDRLVEATTRERTQAIEAQQRLFERLDRFVETTERGQQRMVERLDLLVEATIRDRTSFNQRLTNLEGRVDRLEQERPEDR